MMGVDPRGRGGRVQGVAGGEEGKRTQVGCSRYLPEAESAGERETLRCGWQTECEWSGMRW